MKCGREIEESNVFCPECIQKMAKHPVKPGTAIHIPYRAPIATLKKGVSKKRPLTIEEQNIRLKKVVRGMGITIGSLLLILGITVMVLYQSLDAQMQEKVQGIGRNYSTSADYGGN